MKESEENGMFWGKCGILRLIIYFLGDNWNLSRNTEARWDNLKPAGKFYRKTVVSTLTPSAEAVLLQLSKEEYHISLFTMKKSSECTISTVNLATLSISKIHANTCSLISGPKAQVIDPLHFLLCVFGIDAPARLTFRPC